MKNVIIRPFEHCWEAPFRIDSQWNPELLRKEWKFDINLFDSDPGVPTDPRHQIEIRDNKGELIFCAPLFLNEVGEWSNYKTTFADCFAVEWVSPSLDHLIRACGLAEDDGVILDLSEMVVLDHTEDIVRQYISGNSGWIHAGWELEVLQPQPVLDYINSLESNKFRKNLRNTWNRYQRENWSYIPGNLRDPDVGPLLEEWYMGRFEWDNDDLASLFSHFEHVIGHNPEDVRVMRLEQDGVLVGLDLLLRSCGTWCSFGTPYFKRFKSCNPGWMAILALIDYMHSRLEKHPVSIGFVEYDDTNWVETVDAHFEYKKRWSSSVIPTWVVGKGLWGNRDEFPKIRNDCLDFYLLNIWYRATQILPNRPENPGLSATWDKWQKSILSSSQVLPVDWTTRVNSVLDEIQTKSSRTKIEAEEIGRKIGVFPGGHPSGVLINSASNTP